jgi:hypothetical protein
VDDGVSDEREQKHVFAMFHEQKRGGHRKCIAANEYLQFSHVKQSLSLGVVYMSIFTLNPTCKHLLLSSTQHDKHRKSESVTETRLF